MGEKKKTTKINAPFRGVRKVRKEKVGITSKSGLNFKNIVYICVLKWFFLGLKGVVCRMYFFVNICKKKDIPAKKKKIERKGKKSVYQIPVYKLKDKSWINPVSFLIVSN